MPIDTLPMDLDLDPGWLSPSGSGATIEQAWPDNNSYYDTFSINHETYANEFGLSYDDPDDDWE